jgi:hypothetical protein
MSKIIYGLTLNIDNILILWYELTCPFTKIGENVMILKKGAILEALENIFQSLAIINVHSTLSKEELAHIINILLSQNTRCRKDKNIYHCLLIGNRYLILPLIKQLDQSYYIEWIGDEYCMLTYISTYGIEVPIANVSKQPCSSLEISLYGYKILYTPQIIQMQSFIDLLQLLEIDANGFDIICSVNTHNIDNEDKDHPEWCHFMNHSIGNPGLHYFISQVKVHVLDGHDVMFNNRSTSFSILIMQIPDQTKELERCV